MFQFISFPSRNVSWCSPLSLFSCAHAPIWLSWQVQDEWALLLSEQPALWRDATAPPSASAYGLEIPVTS